MGRSQGVNEMLILNDSGREHLDDADFIHPRDLISRSVRRAGESLMNRRQLLRAAGGLGLMGLLVGCGASEAANGFGASRTITGGTTGGTGSGTCAEIPTEVKGPYPLDGSNGTNALSSIYRSNIVGSDITTSAGVPLLINLNLQNINDGCAALEGAAVYIWHCDQSGGYSGYSSSQNGTHAGKTFCRGIVVTDVSGQASFTTVYPGWYAGRITHIHLAVYLNDDLSSTPKVSQFGFPLTTNQAVYATSPYSTHGQNTSVTSYANDNIFSDGTTYQIATMTGDVTLGLVASLNVGVIG